MKHFRHYLFYFFFFITAFAYAQDTTLYNDTFKLYSKGKIVNGKKEGLWISYDIVNVKSSEGFYKNGLKDGYWKFYLNQYLTSEGNFKTGKREGTWREYYVGGHEIMVGKYQNGMRSGKWLTYENDELQLYEFTYRKLRRKTKLTRVCQYKNGVIIQNKKIE